jgi:hypothetical protein
MSLLGHFQTSVDATAMSAFLPIATSSGFFLIERDTDPTCLSPDNVTMMIAVLCVDY